MAPQRNLFVFAHTTQTQTHTQCLTNETLQFMQFVECVIRYVVRCQHTHHAACVSFIKRTKYTYLEEEEEEADRGAEKEFILFPFSLCIAFLFRNVSFSSNANESRSTEKQIEAK